MGFEFSKMFESDSLQLSVRDGFIYQARIVVIGLKGVGKTSVIKSYLEYFP